MELIATPLLSFLMLMISTVLIKVFIEITYSDLFSTNSIFKKVGFALLNVFQSELDLLRLKRTNSNSFQESLLIIFIVFLSILSIFVESLVSNIYMTTLFWISISICFLSLTSYCVYILTSREVYDQDIFISKVINEFVLIFVLMGTSLIFKTSGIMSTFLAALSALLVFRIIGGFIQFDRMNNDNKFFRHMTIIWAVGITSLISNFFFRVFDFYYFKNGLILNVLVASFLVMLILFLKRQTTFTLIQARFQEKSLRRIYIFVSVIILTRMVIWKL